MPGLKRKGTWQGVQSMLFEPVEPGEKSQIAVIVMHSDGDHLAPASGQRAGKARLSRVRCRRQRS